MELQSRQKKSFNLTGFDSDQEKKSALFSLFHSKFGEQRKKADIFRLMTLLHQNGNMMQNIFVQFVSFVVLMIIKHEFYPRTITA